MAKKRYITGFGSVIAILIGLNVLFLYYSPEQIVNWIGVQNSYLVVFLIAALGGLNSFTSGVLYASIATFAAGGSIPWLIGVAGGLGIAVGDTVIYFLVRYGRQHIPEKTENWLERNRKYIDRLPRWVQYLVIYIYLGFTPLPNDILMFALAMFDFKFKKILPLIILGGITIATIVAYAGNVWFV